jgi:hypothetical protein
MPRTLLALVTAVATAAGLFAWDQRTTQGVDTEPFRIVGKVRVENGGPLAGATIRTDATRGARGRPFGGQRSFTARTDAEGSWSIIGITPGVWILDVTAPGHLPHVLVAPIAMMAPVEPEPWETALALLPIAAFQPPPEAPANAPERIVIQAAEKAVAKDERGTRELLRKLEGALLDPGGLVAAGDIALMIRQPAMARRFFEIAAKAAPQWYRPHLGVAVSAMLAFDIDRAVDNFGRARDGADPSLQRMISGSLKDLRLISDTKK